MSSIRSEFRPFCTCAGALLVVFSIAPLQAQDDDDLEFRPGLLAEYRTGPSSVQRIDPRFAFNWHAAAPDPLLPDGAFAATWIGQFLVREEVTFRFHAYVQGAVRVVIGDQTVLEATQDRAGWVSGPDVQLEFGFQPLNVEYERTCATGRLQLYWSSDRFPLEPLPEALLFLSDDAATAVTVRSIAQRERGRELFAAYRCAACHTETGTLPPEPAPALIHIGAGTSRSWLIAKLQQQHPGAASSRMPGFGFNEHQADALIAYLESVAKPIDLPAVPEIAKDPKRKPLDGRVLLHSLGCLACHRAGELGSDTPFGGGDLSGVGARRSPEWLYAQLREPSRINPHARMPVFELTDAERVAIVDTLSGLGGSESAVPDASSPADDRALVDEGRRLFDAAQCNACHRSPDERAVATHAPRLERDVADWERSCLAASADPTHRRPHFPQADREALQTYVSALIARGGAVSPISPADAGKLVLEQRNCLGCHERGGELGIVPIAGRVVAETDALTGQSQALIPPNLTAVGDKLLVEPLTKSVRGEQPRRMPWLSVRMPKFAHSNADQAALVAHFIDTDRIPADPPATRPVPDSADSQTLIAGRTLTGPHGFSCIACHECGKYVPPNVAIATHGSDLLGFSKRMRPEFFLRWTRSPLRVVPGIEMPSYERPVPGILDGTPDTQLAALWHAIGDPQFSVPTNPTAVEQLLTVAPGEQPRVIRDVFSVAETSGGGHVPRALAMGFDNGLSILFDLDTARVREWTLGEFARQRTQGKSWYWDMAGAPLLKSDDIGFGLWLQLPADEPTFVEPSQAPLEPRGLSPWRASNSRPIQLKSYRQSDGSILVEYEVDFATPAGPVRLPVTEEWRSHEHANAQSVTRTIRTSSIAAGRLLCAVPGTDALTAGASVLVPGDAAERTILPDGNSAHALQSHAETGDSMLTLNYATSLQPPPLRDIAILDPPAVSEPVTTAPGFAGQRLPITTAIMPTAMAWRPDGTLVFTSLKGHVYLAKDTDGDGVEDQLTLFEEGLAGPFGVLADGDDLLVAHKPELLRLRDTDGDGRCDERIVVADGWGYTHDYHDWTAGPVRDADGNLFLAISSDYQQSQRDRSTIQWRGKVLRIDPAGSITPFAHELRFPMGIALDGAGRLFVSDQQGVQNCFNEINHVVKDGRYGVPALADPPGSEDHTRASVQVPHPWTRSVNGITFLPMNDGPRSGTSREGDAPAEPPQRSGINSDSARQEPRPPIGNNANRTPLDIFAGHGLGCEYNTRFLVRFTTQEVKGALQGAVYEFTSPKFDKDSDAFLGPICTAVSPDGSLYVGSIFDSGWLGGQNTGEIVKLTPTGDVPNGIRELRAVPGGFEIEFIHPVDPQLAADASNYALSGYARAWQGAYATPDSDLHSPAITSIEVSEDGRTVTLRVDDLRAPHVYELNCRTLTTDGAALRPSAAHYSMNRLP